MMCANVTGMAFGITRRQTQLGLTPEEREWAVEQDWLETKQRFELDPWYRGIVYQHMAGVIDGALHSIRKAGEAARVAAEQMREALRNME